MSPNNQRPTGQVNQPPAPVDDLDNLLSRNPSTLVALAAKLATLMRPTLYTAGGEVLSIIPDGCHIENMERTQSQPMQIREKQTFIDLDSFLSYYKMYSEAFTPVIFASERDGKTLVEVIFDYHSTVEGKRAIGGTHEKPELEVFKSPSPRWGHFHASLDVQEDPEIRVWKSLEGKWLKQEEFATFLFQNFRHIRHPDAATMLEIAQELEGVKNVAWKQGKRIANGQVSFQWEETIEGKSSKGSIEVPQEFVISVRLHRNFSPVELKLALRWQVDAKGVNFSYIFIDLREKVDQAFKNLVAGIQEKTGKKVFWIK